MLGILKRIAITNVDNWVYARHWGGGELFRPQNDQGSQFCQRLGNSGGNVENSGKHPDLGRQRVSDGIAEAVDVSSQMNRPDLGWQRLADEGGLAGLDEERKLGYLMRKGCSVYLASWEGQLACRYVSCKLSRFKPYSYNRHSLFAGNDAYYIFFCRTYDLFRGKSIFPEMLCHICSDIWEEDPEGTVYISADIKNPASQRGIEKAGFERVGRLRYLSVMNQPLISRLSNWGKK